MGDQIEVAKHGRCALIDFSKPDDAHIECGVCGTVASFKLVIGDTVVLLCPDCLADLGHCVIDGLL